MLFPFLPMASLVTICQEILGFYSEFLAFLKNARLLEAYSFSYTGMGHKMEICEESIFPTFKKYMENLKMILTQCDNLCHSQGKNSSNVKTYTETDIQWESNDCKNKEDPEVNDENGSDCNWETVAACGQVKENQSEEYIVGRELSELHMVVMTNSMNISSEQPSHNSKLVKDETLKVVRIQDGTFSCSACDKTFTSKSAVTRHYRSHTGERPYKCDFCPKCFASKTSLESHLLRAHQLNTETALTCPECGKQFVRRSALEVHLVTHSTNKPFLCEVCGKTFSQKISRDIHVARHTGKYDYRCSVCQKEFASQAKLNAHMYVHRVPRFECLQCGKKFVRRDTLLIHHRTHTGEKPFKCGDCSKAFHSCSNLRLHEQMHSNIYRYKCFECGSQFKHKGGLNSHLKTHHGVLKTSPQTPTSNQQHYLCSECGKEFRKKRSLLEHERVHRPLSAEERRPHVCHLCPKRFTQKSKLNVHIRTHLQEPSFSCEKCGKRFHRKDVYTHHMYLHTNQRPYSCAHCGKAFASKFNLRAHMALHPSSGGRSQNTEHQCLECGKKYKHKNTLTLHRKAHTGQFNHTCATCGKKFMKKSHYDGHLRSHDSERPFQCPTCGKRYKERKHCREHVKRMHPSGFNLETLFASITSEDAQVEDMLCPAATNNPVPEQQQGVVVPISQHSSAENIDTGFLLSPQVPLSQPPIPIPTLHVFPNLDPILHEIQITEASQYMMPSSSEQQQLEQSIQGQVTPSNNQAPLAILSGEDTTSVLSQGLEP